MMNFLCIRVDCCWDSFWPMLGHFDAMLEQKVCAKIKDFLVRKSWGWHRTCLAYVGPCGDYVGPMFGLSWAILGPVGAMLRHVGSALGDLGL